MTDTAPADEMVELRPARAVVVRHQGADLEARAVEGSGPVITLRNGAVWVRADAAGPGVVVTHGASSVEVRSGAVVVEVADVEALLVVVAGRASVRGVSPLPRTVHAGHASTLTLDGVTSDPAPIDANELAADRMIVENLARDTVAADLVAPAEATGGVRVDPPPPPTLDGAPVDAARSDAGKAGKASESGAGRGTSGPPSALSSALRGVGIDDGDGVDQSTVGAVSANQADPAGDDGARRRRTRLLVAVLIVVLLLAAVVAAVVLGVPGGAVEAVARSEALSGG